MKRHNSEDSVNTRRGNTEPSLPTGQEGVETMYGALDTGAPEPSEDIVRAARIDEGAESGGNDLTAKLIWAAGFFDGEGSIGIYPANGGGSFQLTAQVVQVDPRPLRIFEELFGGAVYKRNEENRKKTWRQNNVWYSAAKVAAAALVQMLPYLTVKADEARVAIEFQASKRQVRVMGTNGQGNLPLSDEAYEKQKMAAMRVKELKRRVWS